MGTIPKLNIKGGEGDVQALNRWADAVTTEFADQRSQVHSSNQKATVVTNVVNNIIENPSSLGISDGLVHGDKVFPFDSAYNLLRDDFLRGGTASGTIGELRWLEVQTTSTINYITGVPLHLGMIEIPNSATQGGQNSFFLGNEASNFFAHTAWDLLNNPGWQITWVWGFGQPSANTPSGPAFAITQKSFYIGLGYSPRLFAKGRPDIFIGIRYDTDTTAPAISDTTMKFEVVVNPLIAAATRSNTQGIVIDTKIAPTANSFFRLDIKCVAVGVVTMSLNGSTPVSFTIPSASLMGASSGQVSAGFGVGQISLSAPTGGWIDVPWAAGTKVTASGLSGGNATLNGSYTISSSGSSGLTIDFPFPGTISVNSAASTLSGVPSLMPWFNYGNDTTATPTANVMSVFLDFFGFIWNPGIINLTTVPNATKSRYF